MQFQYYKTNVGIFFKLKPTGYSYYRELDHIKFDDILLKELVELPGSYYKISELPKQVFKKKPASVVVVGFNLTDKTLASDKIPEHLTFEEVGSYYDSDYEVTRWTNFENIRQLYTEQRETLPDSWEPVEAEFILINEIEVENYTQPEKIYVHCTEGNYSGTDYTKELSKIVEISELDRLLVPEFLQHNRPCSLSSKQTYDIVRHFIKNNIDKTKASIRSDYDFCFSVEKIVQLATPKSYKTEQTTPRGKSYRPPRFTNKIESTKQVQIFEMTHDRENYKGYTSISGFKGDNLQDLHSNITQYLNELISVINSKTVECQSCSGYGHHIEIAKVHKE